MSAAMLRPSGITVGVDLGGCVARWRAGSKRQHTLDVYREYGHIPDDVPDDAILASIAEARRTFEGAKEAHRDRDAFWRAINMTALDHLTNPHRRKYTSVYAREIHEAFLDPKRFESCTQVLDAVRKLRSLGITVVIASNSVQAEAETLIDALNVRDEFDAICTSEQFGERKTSQVFWEGVARVAHPTLSHAMRKRMHYIQLGNSLFSDGHATYFGWDVWILDQERRYGPHTPNIRLDNQFNDIQATWMRAQIQGGRIRFISRDTHYRRFVDSVASLLAH